MPLSTIAKRQEATYKTLPQDARLKMDQTVRKVTWVEPEQPKPKPEPAKVPAIKPNALTDKIAKSLNMKVSN